MSKLTHYLQDIESVTECVEITLLLEGKRYNGAAYRDSNFNNEQRLYIIGDLPRSYLRSRRTAYVIDSADWYIACYMESHRLATLKPEQVQYHPVGANFMLCRWDVPSGDAIDKYELRPYRRIPAMVRPGNATLESMINLDCFIDAAELVQWFCRYSVNQRTRGAELFPDRPAGYVQATRDLANYASNKATAMRCRLNGDIGSAQMYEGICQRIYDALPAFARW